jgi:hypothetical protein
MKERLDLNCGGIRPPLSKAAGSFDVFIAIAGNGIPTYSTFSVDTASTLPYQHKMLNK